MAIALLSVTIDANVTAWSLDLIDRQVIPTPYYRLYINDELLTERTWIWGQSTVIEEDVNAQLELNKQYIIRVEPILTDKAQAKFTITVSCGARCAIQPIDECTVSFQLL